MKLVVVRLAVEDDVDMKGLLASVLNHVRVLRGVGIVSEEGASTILTSASSVAEGTEIAEFIAAGDGSVELE